MSELEKRYIRFKDEIFIEMKKYRAHKLKYGAQEIQDYRENLLQKYTEFGEGIFAELREAVELAEVEKKICEAKQEKQLADKYKGVRGTGQQIKRETTIFCEEQIREVPRANKWYQRAKGLEAGIKEELNATASQLKIILQY